MLETLGHHVDEASPRYDTMGLWQSLTTLLTGIILAWIYANTKGSIFAAMLGHAMFNWSNYVFPALEVDAAGLILFGFYFLIKCYQFWDIKNFFLFNSFFS